MPRRAMPKKNGPRTGQANTKARPKRQPAQRQPPPQQGGGGEMYAGGTQGYNEMDPYQYAGDGYSPMMAQGGQQSYGGGVPGVPVGGGGFWAGGNGSAPGYPTSGGGGVPRAPVGGGSSSSGFVQGGKDLGGGHIAGTGQGGPPRPYDPNQNY